MRRDYPGTRCVRAGFDGGAFQVRSVEPGWVLFFIASWSGGWEHASVRALRASGRERQRVPTWKEMVQIRQLCWPPDDCVMQLHPPAADYVNTHPCVLHLWRPVHVEIPRPPMEFV